MNKILIQFHYFGPIVLTSPKIFLDKTGDFQDNQRLQLASFLAIKPVDLTQELVERYIEITPKEDHQVITPAHDRIRARIVEPLKVARKSFCFEEYMSSIALCGIVGETMAHVFYQMKNTHVNGTIIDSNLEKSLFGNNFDHLGQNRRIEILDKLGYISLEQKKILTYLQKTRVPYMHWWNLGKTADDIKSDAKKAVIEAMRIFSSVFNIKLASSSSISVEDETQAFLDKVGESIGKFYDSCY